MKPAEAAGSGLPRISILMAVYEPRMDWLRTQLQSLNAQTYPNLRLYVRDDCSPKVPFTEVERTVGECVTAFPFTIERNGENLGSNGTFERLTWEAEGDLFAYCDQDDEWLPEKLTVLQSELTRTGALLACSDMFVMDGNGKTLVDSIQKVRHHHVFRSGAGLAPKLLFSNFVTGCTMLVRAKAAKAAVPFCPYMVHDHYLALWCAERGGLLSVPSPLIRYRIHGGNQTGLLAGVHDKKSYGALRIDLALQKLLWLKDQFPCCEEMKTVISQGTDWMLARQRNWNRHGGACTVWKYRWFSPLPSLFELFANRLPEPLFLWFIELNRKNIL